MTRAAALAIAPFALALTAAALALAGAPPFGSGDDGDRTAPQAGAAARACRAGRAPRPVADRVDGARTFALVRRQVALGPRPAGSRASRRLAEDLRRRLPGGRLQRVRGGLRNVVGTVPGRDPGRLVVVGAHYDTKDIPGFLGANDGAAGTAAVVQIARSLRPRQAGPTVVFILFDGEESPRGTPDADFERRGLRGSRAAAPRYAGAEAMVLLDFVGDRRLSIPREENSDPALWRRLRRAADRVGVGCVFPSRSSGAVIDDHVPFLEQGVPAIDLIDFDFPCFHRRCDDLSAVSEGNLDAVAEAVRELVATL